MTLLQLIEHLRVSILDDTGGDSLDWTDVTDQDETVHLLRWSNEELTRFINQAQKEAAKNAKLIFDNSKTITTQINVKEYPLDSNIFIVDDIYDTVTGKYLEATDIKLLATQKPKTQIPTHYSLNESSGTIQLYPTPSDVRILGMFTFNLPKKDFSFSSSGDNAEIREEFQIPMLWYAAFLAYNKDEPNTLDPQKALLYKNLFEEQFGKSSAYSTTKLLRKRSNTVKYVGL